MVGLGGSSSPASNWRARLLLAAGLLFCASPALADPSTESYSPYEQESIDLALERQGATLDPHPEGKRIRAILVDVLDVIEDRDPIVPNFLNWFHSNSRDYVIERELLFRTGDGYEVERVSESERNLRELRQLSAVVIVPLRTGDPETVDVLVIAKDIWSLRLNSDYRVINGELELLMLQPAEENLAGTHRRLLGNFIYEPDTLTFGGRFMDPRMAGSRISWVADANVIVNQESGDPEGSYGLVQYGLPLYSTRQKWAWGAAAGWHTEVTRRFSGASLLCAVDGSQDYCANVEGDPRAIPWVYDTEIITGRVSVTRSFGRDLKSDFTLGAEADRSVYRTPDLSAYDPVAAEEFREGRVPRTETRNGPYLQYHFYLNDFVSLLDVETLDLQESYLLGPELHLRFYPVAQAFGSTRDFLGYHGVLAYTHSLAQGLARAYVAGNVETEIVDQGMTLPDSEVQGGIRVVTPEVLIGRLIYDAALLYRPNNYSNKRVTLGGEGRLRGYPSMFYRGENLVASNLEFRSRPLHLATVLVAGALFYDAADAFDGRDIRIKHGLGFGLRVLFPQLERSVMRFDWGFALSSDPNVTSPFEGLVLTFRQAFGVPKMTPRGVETETR